MVWLLWQISNEICELKCKNLSKKHSYTISRNDFEKIYYQKWAFCSTFVKGKSFPEKRDSNIRLWNKWSNFFKFWGNLVKKFNKKWFFSPQGGGSIARFPTESTHGHPWFLMSLPIKDISTLGEQDQSFTV